MEDSEFLIELELLDLNKNEDEAFASISLNPAIVWTKFVLTDDLANANKQRIPQKEFDNLIKTGIFMPIKMAVGKINDGHTASVPLGVISHLKKVNNQIHGLAALWDRERPEDVKLIKDRYSNGQQLQLSWEIMYKNASVMEDGVTDLEGTALRAVTFVGEPAYEGRTPIIAVASIDDTDSSVWTRAYIDDLPDSSFLLVEAGGTKDENGKTTPRTLRHLPYKDKDGKVDQSHLENAIQRAPQVKLKGGSTISSGKATEIQNKARKLLGANSNLEVNNLEELDQLKARIAELEASLTAKDVELKTLNDKFVEKDTELSTLREFKSTIDKEKESIEKLAAIQTKFKSANLEKDDEYFVENKEKLLSLEPDMLDFMIQEMVSFSSKTKDSTSSKVKVPPMSGGNSTTVTQADMLSYLQSRVNRTQEK